MADYQFAVLFEANDLSDGEMRKIRNYFKIKRLSDGGECGEVVKVGNNTYKINFLEKEAQDRVLSKTDHIINLPGRGDVHILIKHHDIKEEKPLLPHSTSEKQATGDTPMQKVLCRKLNPYLLRFLKDNSKAKSHLDDQLSSLLSSFKVDMVTEKVLVMREAGQSGDDVQQKWEAKVDMVLLEIQDRYFIHFEVDPKRLEILQKNSSLVSQDLGIYEEKGLAVIVGANKEVEKCLNDIDALLLPKQARKECPVSETRYALVKEQFKQEMKSNYTKITITKEEPGSLVLSGPEDQVQSASTKLQEVLNQIQEKKIPLPHSLKAFLSSSGAIQIFQTRFQQNLCSPVLIEPTGSRSDLVLMSLSAGAIQEAATAIQRDLCVETVVLEKSESVSPGIDALKNSLNLALQQANHGTTKVELSYKPGSMADPRMKVQLVGYSTEVNKLKNAIQLHKQNYAGDVHVFIKHHDIKEEKPLLPHSTSEKQATGDTPMQKVLCRNLDPYLLRFLKDNSKAKSHLDDQLSSLLSSFKVDMVTEKVLVMREAGQSGDDVQQKWEAKVDMVLLEIQDRYFIHFEVDPKRLEILQKNSSLVSQDLGIYEEKRLAVIVGANKEVEKCLNDIDALLLPKQARKECPVSETRYALVKEQFKQEMKSNYTKITITKEEPGSLVLSGPEDQVQSASTKLQDVLNQIQEKKIPLPHSLKAFLSSSGAIQIFQTRFQQNLCSPVLIEPTGSRSDLVLMSLSAGAIQEAATAIQRDLCVETVVLEKSESVSPGIDALKNSLNLALQQANHGTTKVGLSYKPGSMADPRMKVQLVGYSTEVNKLKNAIQLHKQNYAEYSDTVPLSLPELVDNFSKVLSLVGVKATDVKLMASSTPFPCVHVSGPWCKVSDMKKKLNSLFSHLKLKKTSVDGPGAQQFFQEEGLNTQRLLESSCKVLITPINNVQSGAATARSTTFTSLPTIPALVSHPRYSVALKIVFGGLENQQADVLVAPLFNTNLTSTNVGKALLKKAGQQLKSNFDAAKGRCRITPGDVLEVDGTPLGCKKVFFIECVPWAGNTHNSEQALRRGIKQALALSEQQAWSSVAFPVIGPGVVLAMPVQNATNILVGEIETFGLAASIGSLRTIQIVIMPNNPDSEQIYQTVSSGLTAIMVDQTGQAALQSLSSEIDEITIPLARCQVHLIFGDISSETTDVIVNTTDFTDLQTDVCSDILTIAGPQVRAALTGVQVTRGEIFVTQPGGFPCKAIMHVCGEKDTAIIKTLAQDILLKSEHSGYQSVAIPAICAGKGGLDARLVAQAILQGVKDATVQANLNNVKIIHIVLKKIHVFLEFKTMAQQIFGSFTQMTAPLLFTPHRAAPSSLSLDCSSLFQALPDQHTKAEFLVVGLTNDNVSKACKELNQSYRSHCTSQFVSQEELGHLISVELDDIVNNVTSLGIQISKQGTDGLKVSGLTKGVNKFMELIRGALVRQVKEKEQDELFSRVSWCILGLRGIWERLPKQAHHQLEKKNVAEGILDARGQKWTVNLLKMEATARWFTHVAKLKRLENLPDFFFPLYWDIMTTGELLKVVPLHPSSAEYKRVKNDFKRTVTKAVVKIERIQNVNLRRAYEVRKNELQNYNGTDGAGERVLYHGTTDEACASIQRINFNRRFAGQNGTVYGHGTYFAVNASYSANPTYSTPSDDGTQLMFVTLVLTGRYTEGKSDMKVPPPRSSQNPNDRFDSVVDNMQNPGMFVVFHDCQAYPDYLITFK
ncbi:hypothetical protein KOW79_006666 [Hemibagrus wyckioides]|uniref:Poly [ADP-ribose] polymerase n=2 Tax=Hemibagrus wyckioides TaxID=337641 RepID=A0A9D3NXP8_9TELE|nr:hypothetical protein KOW79_006666 [Hemibagrus wyckioides]